MHDYSTKGHGKTVSSSVGLFAALIFLSAQAALAQPGSVDTNFNANATASPESILVQPDGRILTGLTRLLTNGANDPSFHVNLPAGSEVSSTALQPDGRLLISGQFFSVDGVPRPCIARVETNGALDASFVAQLMTSNPPPPLPPNPTPSVTNSVGHVLVQADGKILIYGLLNVLTTNGTRLPAISRLNPDGSVDETFGITNTPSLVALQSDGKIVVAQTFYLNPYPGSSTILRFNTNGTPDATFVPPAINGWVNAISPQDGKLVIGGILPRINGVNCDCIARLLSNGSLDTGFHSDVSSVGIGVAAILPQSDGRMLIGGGFSAPNSPCRNFARLNADGSFDATYVTNGTGPGNFGYVYALAGQPDGKVLVGGEFTMLNGVAVPYFGRLNGDSAASPGWIQFDPSVYELSEGAGPAILKLVRVGGTQGKVTVNYHTESGTALAGSDFEEQSGVIVFDDGESQQSIAITLIDDTEIEDLEFFKVVLTETTGGAALGLSGVATVNIQDNDGPASLDAGFAVPLDSFDGQVRAIATQNDGKILVGGLFQQAGRVPRVGIARLQADGGLDSTFDPGSGALFNGSPGGVNLIRLQDDGEILIAGPFNTFNGVNRNHMVRLNTNGVLDAGFDVGAGAVAGSTVADIRAFELLPGGNLIVAGGFTTFNGVSRNGLARLDNNGGVDLSYNPAGGQPIMPFGLLANGKVTYARMHFDNVSRINADGSYDNANLATANSTIFKVQSLANSNTLVCGVFTNVGGLSRFGIARLLPAGTVDPAFVPDLTAFVGGIVSPYIYLFAPQNDGKVLIALKSFRAPAGNYLARLNSDGTLDTDFEPVQFAIPVGDNDTISAIEVQPDGKIIVGGMFQTVNGLPHPYLIRLRGGGKSGARKLAIKSLAIVNNQSQLTLNVSAGKPFALLTSTNMINWTPVSTNIVPVSTFVVVDSPLMQSPQRYYRVMQLVP